MPHIENEKPIMVADDDAAIRTYIQDVLEMEGRRVVTAGDGRTVLNIINSPDHEMPSLILLDMSLPGMSGIEVSQRVKGRVPIVAVTGYERSHFKEALVDDYLPKPFDTDDLMRIVNKYSPSPALARACA